MHKKGFLLIPVISVTIIVFCLFLSTCDNTDSQAFGVLKLHMKSKTIRTLLPDIDMDIATYDIYGSGPRGASFELLDFPSSTVILDDLILGDWVIRVDGRNADGIVIGSGTTTAHINTGETTVVNITVTPLSGTGVLDLTLNWNEEDTYLPSIDCRLTSIEDDTETVLDFAITGGNQGTYTGIFPDGYYVLQLMLLDNGLLTYGVVEMVRIVNGGTTTGVFNFTEINLPGGTVDININPEMNDDLDITITGDFVELPFGETATVSASVDPEAGPVVYVWYINGQFQAIGQNFTITADDFGIFSVNVTAATVDGLRGGATGFVYRTPGGEPTSGFQLLQGSTKIAYNGLFDFDTIPAIDRDKPVVFTIRNPGTVSLILTGSPLVEISGDDAVSFTVNTSATAVNISPGGTTTFTIQYTALTNTNAPLNASIAIPNSIHAIDPFPFDIRCTDKISGTLDFDSAGTHSFNGAFTAIAAIQLCSGGGGGGGGGGSYYRPPTGYDPAINEPGSMGGNGGGGYLVTVSSFQMLHGIAYEVIVGGGGAGGAGGAIRSNGSAGGNGQPSRFIAGGVVVQEVNGGGGGSGGRANSTIPGSPGAGGTCCAGGLGGNGGASGTSNPGQPGTPGSIGNVLITWRGFVIP